MNVVELNRDATYKSFRNFNTHSNEAASAAMTSYLEGVPMGTIVMIAVKGDGAQELDEGAKSAMRHCGALLIGQVAYQDSYALIGRKGRKRLSEAHAGATAGKAGAEEDYQSPTMLLPIGATIALAGGKDNMYCADVDVGITCNVDAAGPWEIFTIKDAGDGNIALQGGRDNKYCSDNGDKIICNRNTIGATEMFRVADAQDGKVALARVSDQKFCTDNGGSGLRCDSATTIGTQETFQVECISGCPHPAPLRFPMEFFFGSYSPKQRFQAILDAGQGYSEHNRGTYGWNCDGDVNVDYSSGRRGLDRECGNGLNHFDEQSTCKVGDDFKPVNWEVRVPNGPYDVMVDFGCAARDDRSGCMVEGQLACEGKESGPCVFQSRVEVTDGRFTITGYGQDAKKCHSLSHVVLKEAPKFTLLEMVAKKCPEESGLFAVTREDCESAATHLGKAWKGVMPSVFAPGGCYLSANHRDVLYNPPSDAGPSSEARLICNDRSGS
jgi:hypothetical protein